MSILRTRRQRRERPDAGSRESTVREEPGPLKLDDDLMDRLEAVRLAILRSPDLSMPQQERDRAARYELRIAGPDVASVPLEVEVVRGGIDGGDGDIETVQREVELTPQIVAESPGGVRLFVAWNHVARIFVIWLTPDARRALRSEAEPIGSAEVRRLPVADGSA